MPLRHPHEHPARGQARRHQGGASGSTGIQNGGKQMRAAAAEARRILVEMAAQKFGVKSDGLIVVDGIVRLKDSSDDTTRSESYADLIGGRYFNTQLEWNKQYGNALYAPGKAVPKKPSEYKIVGKEIARACYAAYESGDPAALERHLSDDLVFYSPPDPGIDRAEYFERCWPNAGLIESFDLIRMIEAGDEVVVTYEGRRADGTRFRNTEVLSFAGDRVRRAEVYFGWDVA